MMAIPPITTVTLNPVTPGLNSASRKSRSVPPHHGDHAQFLGHSPRALALGATANRQDALGLVDSGRDGDLRSFPRTGRLWVKQNPVGAYRLGDVFDLLRTKILEARVQLVPHAVIDDAGDRDPTRRRDLLHAGCDIDAVAVNVVALDDHVAEVDADAENDLLILGHAGIARGHPR